MISFLNVEIASVGLKIPYYFLIIVKSHPVDNPDAESEMYLLRQYAPDVSIDILMNLTALFSDLRKMVDEGLLSYPYSLR